MGLRHELTDLYISTCFSSTAGITPIVAYEKSGLKIDFTFERVPDQPTVVMITLTATNSNSQPLNEFVFQAAVPKVRAGGNCENRSM